MQNNLENIYQKLKKEKYIYADDRHEQNTTQKHTLESVGYEMIK